MQQKVIPEKKLKYGQKLRELVDEFSMCLIVGVDNVSSRQLSQIRRALRGKAVVLMGKNTMIRKIIRDHIKKGGARALAALANVVQGNVGFIFTKEPIAEIRNVVAENRVSAPAKSGVVAPVDVFIPPGPTGMEPTQTSFFQSMNIPTRINRGQIDIINQMHLIKKGEKVGPSESALLSKLNIKPFFYGMTVKMVYDNGATYSADVLDITDDIIAQTFMGGLGQVAALSLAIDYPTIVAVPHSVLNAYKSLLALGLKLEKYSWENLAKVKEMLENPDAFIEKAAAPAVAEADAAPVEEDKESEKSSSDVGGGGLFGGSGSDSDSD